jgi:hypothetical protein
MQLVRYIHRNPLRAGLVSRMDRYRWSSHRGYLSEANKWKWLHKEFVMSMLTSDKADRVKEYRRFVRQQDAEGLVTLLDTVNLPAILGDGSFMDWVKGNFFKGEIEKDIPQSKTLVPETMIVRKVVCDFYKVSIKELTALRRGARNEPRDVAIYLLRTLCGEPLMEIGSEFGMRQYSSVSSAVIRVKARRGSDREFSKRLDRIEELVKKGQ